MKACFCRMRHEVTGFDRLTARITAVVVALLLPLPAAAIVYVIPTAESMVDRSPLIVFGEVPSAEPGERRGRPATNYLLDVEEVLKGAVGGATLIVQQPGGVDDDGVASWIMGLPMLAEGDRVLLFLREREEYAHDVAEYALGMFWEVAVGGCRLLLREPSLEGQTPPAGEPALEPEESRPPRDGALFRPWIADRAAGLERPADYFAAEPPNGPVAVGFALQEYGAFLTDRKDALRALRGSP